MQNKLGKLLEQSVERIITVKNVDPIAAKSLTEIVSAYKQGMKTYRRAEKPIVSRDPMLISSNKNINIEGIQIIQINSLKEENKELKKEIRELRKVIKEKENCLSKMVQSFSIFFSNFPKTSVTINTSNNNFNNNSNISENDIMSTISNAQNINNISNNEDKDELNKKLEELKNIINDKNKKGKVKEILSWIFDKSIDVFISLVPVLNIFRK